MASATAKRGGIVGKLLVLSLILVSIVVTAFVGWAIFTGVGDSTSLINKDQYQAVFLSDGQIYFGKVDESNEDYLILEDIYYLQVEQQVQPEREGDGDQPSQPRISLAKLGNELHGPEDAMYINRTNILFWENLKDDGRVTQAITEYVENGPSNGDDGNGEEEGDGSE